MALDIALTTRGDLALSAYGDLLEIEDVSLQRRQRLVITLFTNAPDFGVFPSFGANLEDLLGRDISDPNTIDLAQQLIEDAVPDIDSVICVPNNALNSLTILIRHPDYDNPVALVFSLDEGLLAGDEAENLIYDSFSEG